MPAPALACLRAFPTALYNCFDRRADALFALGDAVLTADSVTSFPHLSLQTPHRRSWGSLYDALAAGRFDGEVLRATLA